jgi:two-component system, NtrC family, sensor kinase
VDITPRSPLYIGLQRKIIFLTLLVAFVPLVLMGGTIYWQFARIYREKIDEQLRYRAATHGNTVDVFLSERTAVLTVIADTHNLDYMLQPGNLAALLEAMNLRAGGFLDLGVIDSDGRHLVYVGPYHLEGLNYSDWPWFAQVMTRGAYVSDVFMGYRKIPHFIIAVRHQEKGRIWILRATIDSDVFTRLVRGAQVGKTGDAFIVNGDGITQTAPRFLDEGGILGQSRIEPSKFGEGTSVLAMPGPDGRNRLYAGTWLKNIKWLLVISQDPAEKMAGLSQARSLEIGIVLAGALVIILTVVLATRLMVKKLVEADRAVSEMNAQLVQSDKLAAMGKMAASVAHEVNNPLAVIGEKTGWALDLLEEEEFQQSKNVEEFRRSLRKIEEHVERARKVVHNMLGFARRMEPRTEDVDINQVIDQTISLLENYARTSNIDIQTHLAADLPIIASDQAQLQQVFLNLVSNAIDAIANGGAIEVSTRQLDGNIYVNIKDDGPGMTPEMQKKIFEPFFTTKSGGKGTGLGLSVSLGLVEKMGGTITVESKVGEGCTFTVKLPIVVPEKK